MSGTIQAEFSSLQTTIDDPLWKGKPNAWVRELPPAAVGKIGERLAQVVLGGVVEPNNRAGFDLTAGDKRIEVKLSTQLSMSGYPILIWRQIRPADPYTHICFIAVYPSTVRMFLVPKLDIPSACLAHQHGRNKSNDIFQVHTRHIHTLFPWMTRHEVS